MAKGLHLGPALQGLEAVCLSMAAAECLRLNL
jgi:hypothetical protein